MILLMVAVMEQCVVEQFSGRRSLWTAGDTVLCTFFFPEECTCDLLVGCGIVNGSKYPVN
jgi:hypothetical protein